MQIFWRIVPALIGLLFWMGATPKPPVLIRVHLQATEGAKGMVSVPVTLFSPSETIAIQSVPEVTEKEIQSISRSQDGTILVQFTDFGATKLEVATSTGRGSILVVIVNGREVYAHIIDTVFKKCCLLLTPGSITPEEEDQVNGEMRKDKEQRLKDISH